MKLKNTEMESMLSSLEKHLDRRDVVGYAAARNTRLLQGELREFLEFRNELVVKHGEEAAEGDAAPGGKFITPQSPSFGDFMAEYGPLCSIEHDVSLFTVPYDEAIGVLSGSELLEIDWMFHEGV